MQLNLDVPDPIDVVTDAHAEKILYRFLKKLDLEPRDWIAYDDESHAKKMPFTVSNKHPLDWMTDTVTFWSLSARFDGRPERYCFEQQHLTMFHRILENPKARIATWHGNYDAHVSFNSGIYLYDSQLADLQVAAQMVNENIQKGGMDLKKSAERGFTSEHKRALKFNGAPTDDVISWKTIPMSPYRTIFGDKDVYGNKAIEYITSLYNLPRDKVANYSSLDSYSTLLLAEHLVEVLTAHDCSHWSGYGNLWEYFWEFERLVTEVYWRMERRGIEVDIAKLKEKVGPIEKEKEEIQARINQEARRPINLKSTPQLAEFLFGTGPGNLGLKVKGLTDGGKPSTDEETLLSLAAEGVEIAQHLTRYRKIDKIESTYVEPLIQLAEYHVDKKIHPEFLQYGAKTGRPQSKYPNSMNFPTASNDNLDDGGFGIRAVFSAGPCELIYVCGQLMEVTDDYVLIIADFSQIEMRIMAHFSQDPTMLAAIKAGRDLHCITVERMFGVAYDKAVKAKKFKEKFNHLRDNGSTVQGAAATLGVDSHEVEGLLEIAKLRDRAKTIGFAIFYGAGAANISMQLEVPFEEAEVLLEKYFDAYPGVRAYIKRTIKNCERDLFVTTLLGRRRNLPEITSPSWGTRGEARREAVNSRIQGSAADLLKASMIACEFDPELQLLGCSLRNSIHDELVFKCPRRHAARACEIIKGYMEHPFEDGKDPLDVPTPVDIKEVANWSQK